MINVVTATKSNNTITVLVNEDGNIKPIPATSEHPKWAEILKAWAEQNYDALLELLSLKRIVEKFSSGNLVVSDSGVFYKDVPLVGVDVDRIMAFLRVGDPYQPIAKYMERKLKNPSKRAITEMYNFLEHKQMSLTPSGTFLAYKGVLPDFFSVSSGKEVLLQGRRNDKGQIFNGVGETIEMNRSDVDDDFRVGCSGGLHAGSLEYAREWARQHKGIIVVVEIDPADVVSVPEDCQCKKLRCNKYTVIGLYNGPLPDTYTAEFEKDLPPLDLSECVDCGQNPCDCEKCETCGYHVDECDCDETAEECPCPTCENKTPDPMSHLIPKSLGGTDTLDNMVEVSRDENATKGLWYKKETTRELLCPETVGDEIRQKYVAIVCEQLGVAPNNVTDNSEFIADLGADSLDLVELVMALESDFLIQIPDEVAEPCNTVGKGIAAVRELVKQQVSIPAAIPTMKSPPTKINPLDVMTKNLDKVLEQNETDVDSYQNGYALGLRNGVRRRKRMYRDNDKINQFQQGYCDGYRAGRKDYKK